MLLGEVKECGRPKDETCGMLPQTEDPKEYSKISVQKNFNIRGVTLNKKDLLFEISL